MTKRQPKNVSITGWIVRHKSKFLHMTFCATRRQSIEAFFYAIGEVSKHEGKNRALPDDHICIKVLMTVPDLWRGK